MIFSSTWGKKLKRFYSVIDLLALEIFCGLSLLVGILGFELNYDLFPLIFGSLFRLAFWALEFLLAPFLGCCLTLKLFYFFWGKTLPFSISQYFLYDWPLLSEEINKKMKPFLKNMISWKCFHYFILW